VGCSVWDKGVQTWRGAVGGGILRLPTRVRTTPQADDASYAVSYQIEDITMARTARVMAAARYPGGLFYAVPAPLLELTYHEPDEGTVKVEARRGPLGSALDLTGGPMIEQCGGSASRVTPRP